MKTCLLIAAMSTVLLVGCSASSRESFIEWLEYHPDCTALQKAERRNAKDLEAYCYTEQTQNSLKCEQAKARKRDLQISRERVSQEPGSCPQQF